MFQNRDKIISNGQTTDLKRKRRDALDILDAALEAVNPYKAVCSRFKGNKIVIDNSELDVSKFNKVYIVGFGKASIGMVQAVVDSINVTKGVAVTNDPEGLILGDQIEVVIGGHPLPNEGSISGAKKIMDIVKQCTKDDLLIVLISGGGSALLCQPRVNLENLQKTTDLLLKSGADINEINTIRKHLSHVKGGQLVKNASCQVISLIISDIVNDPLEFIASGPTSPDSTTFLDAQKILKKYNLWEKIPSEVMDEIEKGGLGNTPETPKQNDPIFKKVTNCIVANNKVACNAAINKAELLGYKVLFLTSSLTGEAKDIGQYLVEKAKSHDKNDYNYVFISGGETTVTIHGTGRGGRNQEMVLATVEKIAYSDIVFASFATDGRDGASDAAGGITDSYSSERAKEKKLDYIDFLNDNNSYEFLKKLDDIFITGPTGTNVMDIQIIIC